MFRPVHFILHFIYIVSLVSRSDGKTFTACELVMELTRQDFPVHQMNDWLCLIEAESSMRTEVIGGPDDDGSFDHGLFQINDRYWCSIGESPGKGCNVTCTDLVTDDITAASECALKIYEQQGFSAWLGWRNECKDKKQHDVYC